jgi:hypothetical protein
MNWVGFLVLESGAAGSFDPLTLSVYTFSTEI